MCWAITEELHSEFLTGFLSETMIEGQVILLPLQIGQPFSSFSTQIQISSSPQQNQNSKNGTEDASGPVSPLLQFTLTGPPLAT